MRLGLIVVIGLLTAGCATLQGVDLQYATIPADDPRRVACRDALKADAVIAVSAAIGASPASAAGAVAKVAARYLKGDPTLVQDCLPLIIEAV